MYGSDWRYGECYGLETNLDAPNHLYGFIMPQFYLEVGYNDLTVKIGHYAPSIGYEVVAAPGNFFYSHSYALGYSEPVLVTGVSGRLQAQRRLELHRRFSRRLQCLRGPQRHVPFPGRREMAQRRTQG